MRYTVVKKELPMGVNVDSQTFEKLFGEGMPFAPVSVLRTANFPLTLSLEVPLGKERDVAKALREMAEELER